MEVILPLFTGLTGTVLFYLYIRLRIKYGRVLKSYFILKVKAAKTEQALKELKKILLPQVEDIKKEIKQIGGIKKQIKQIEDEVF